jgi:two-component system, LytTR family, response regulator
VKYHNEMNPLRAILIDDEPDAIAYLLELLKDFPEVEVCATVNDSSLVMDAFSGCLPDIVFLDIQMPGKDGFEVLREIRQLNHAFYLVFITAFDKYAIEAVRQAAFDYLLKPVDPEELRATLARVKTYRLRNDHESRIENLLNNLDKNKKLRFNNRTGFIIVNSSDIIYIESDRNYSTLFLKDGKKEVVTMNLGNVEEMLPSTFYRISRFHIINTGFLVKVDRKKHLCALVTNGASYELPVNAKNIRGMELI